MRIGIIGAGQIGGTLTRRLTALGHEVFVANSRGAETLSDLAAETGTTAVSVPEAVRGVDLVVVTIPEKNIPSLSAGGEHRQRYPMRAGWRQFEKAPKLSPAIGDRVGHGLP